MHPQQISIDTLRQKYAINHGETTEDEVFRRVAKHVASVEKTPDLRAEWEEKFYQNMKAGALGAGRIMASAGAGHDATLMNCFVQPVGDCVSGFDDDGYPGIYDALKEAAETMRRGGGVGYDFSRIRPKNALVKGTNSASSGPCAFIDVFDKSCSTVESAGARRGAQMGVLRIDHPDVLEFIIAKRTPGRWNNFNVSVGVTDPFIEAVKSDADWELIHKAQPAPGTTAQQRTDGTWVYSTVKAREIWGTIMQSTYDFAEPGILFIDKMNKDNNLWYCEQIEATNPCGEQPLPPYGCCDLGPINLARFVRKPFTPQSSFDLDAFRAAVAIQVRFLDNVLDATSWPLQQQREEAMAKRRIGVGFTGLGNALAMSRLRYDSDEGRDFAVMIAEYMQEAAYEASVELAKEKGAFPLFDAEKYLSGNSCASRLPGIIKDDIRKHGIRNSHLLSIAPTGTVSLAFCDNASNGIEPPFSWTYTRKKREQDGSESFYTVEDHAYRLYKEMHPEKVKADGTVDLTDYFVNALEMSAEDHVKMLEAVQPYIDTSISKTVNIPVDYPFEDFNGLYLQAFNAGLKGLATYRPNDTLGSVLSVGDAKPAPTPVQVIDSRPVGDLPAVSRKLEYTTIEGLAKQIYLIVSFMQLPDGSERPIEFFMPAGQMGEMQWVQAAMRGLSRAARGGLFVKALDDLMQITWDRGPIRYGTIENAEGITKPRFHQSEVALIAYAIQEIVASRKTGSTEGKEVVQSDQVLPGSICTECGAHAVIKKDGCSFCTSCGHAGSCG